MRLYTLSNYPRLSYFCVSAYRDSESQPSRIPGCILYTSVPLLPAAKHNIPSDSNILNAASLLPEALRPYMNGGAGASLKQTVFYKNISRLYKDRTGKMISAPASVEDKRRHFCYIQKIISIRTFRKRSVKRELASEIAIKFPRGYDSICVHGTKIDRRHVFKNIARIRQAFDNAFRSAPLCCIRRYSPLYRNFSDNMYEHWCNRLSFPQKRSFQNQSHPRRR